MNNNRIESLLEETVAATNRTTSAVRGIARFLLIEVTTALIGTGLIVLGTFSTEIFIYLGALIVLGGLIWAAMSLKAELEKSEIPSRPRDVLQSINSNIDRMELGLQDLDRQDWQVYSNLSEKEKRAWRDKGMPSLKNWDGKRSFESWINDDPFSVPTN